MAQTKRRSEPTHPTVWVGLAFALAGLVVALYAYTGPRVYDIIYFFVAILGGVLSLGGILTAAWGRAIGQARRQRSRRLAVAAGGSSVVRTGTDDSRTGDDGRASSPPTVAAPPEKKGLLARLKPSGGKGGEKGAAEASDKPKPVFAFKRRAAASGEAGAAENAPAEAGSGDADAGPRKERVTLQCPECATTFSQEGTRPFRVACPNCAFSADV